MLEVETVRGNMGRQLIPDVGTTSGAASTPTNKTRVPSGSYFKEGCHANQILSFMYSYLYALN